MARLKKHVEFSESVKKKGDKEDLLRASSAPEVGRLKISTPHSSGRSHSSSQDSPSPFSPEYSSTTGDRSLEYSSSFRYPGGGEEKDVELDEEQVGDKSYGTKQNLAPESAITLFAFRLAVLEKLASNLGTLAFLWATVVLLGGFATTARGTDFWVVAVLLLTEGVRIFGRSHELEWQHVASKSTESLADKAKRVTSQAYKAGSDAVYRSSRVVRSAFHSQIHKPENGHHGVDAEAVVDDGKKPGNPPAEVSYSAPILPSQGRPRAIQILKKAAATPGGRAVIEMKRAWSLKAVPLIPYSNLTLLSAQAISVYLYWMQICSALSSVGLSMWRLSQQDFVDKDSGLGKAKGNLILSLNLFYGLALAEAAIFLVERAYWEVKLSHEKIIVKVSNDYKLRDPSLQRVVKAFFYEVYSKSLNGSVLNGLEMDLVGYSIDLIQSDNAKQQLHGSQLLAAFVNEVSSAEATLRRIGTTPGIFDRLVEMLSWHNEDEEVIRTAAAEILNRLVLFSRNSFRIAGIAGSMEGIVSLLNDAPVKGPRSFNTSQSAIKLRLLGLRILKYLARDHNNRARIGATKSLLPILVACIHVKQPSDLPNEVAASAKIFKKSLQLLNTLASTPGQTGQQLRTSILRIIYAVKNVRDILEYGAEHPTMQRYALDLLIHLAMDEDVKVRENLGNTGGLIRNLVSLLDVKTRRDKEVVPISTLQRQQLILAEKAGESLNLLAFQNHKNCRKMIQVRDAGSGEKIPTLHILMQHLAHPDLGTTAAKILRSFCVYAAPEDKDQLVSTIPAAFQLVMLEKGRHQEAATGLAAQALHQLEWKQQFKLDTIFLNLGVDKQSFVDIVVNLIPLKTSLPNLRRHAVELMDALMVADAFFVTKFREAGLEKKLHLMLDTVWDVENFFTFSGHIGLTRHGQDMEDLVNSALAKLESAD